MTVQPVDVRLRFLFMKAADDYVPVEIWHEAKDFIKDISDDVGIYEKFRSFENNLSEEALKFSAWWSFKRYVDYPHSLILLYENIERIQIEIGTYDVLDGFRQLEFKLVLLYRLLKENGMINE